MLTKETITLRFDNYEECKRSQTRYERMGYIITGHGADEEWFFSCKKYYTKED